MSDDSFSVNTDGLHEQMPYMQELAEQFHGIGSNLRAVLDDLGECWGDDATGQQFLEQYTQPKEQILEGIGDTGDVLDSTADGIKTMAVQFERLEEENIAAVKQLAPSDIDTDGSGSGDHGPDGRPGKA